VLATPTSPPGSSTAQHRFRVGDRVFGASQGGYATHILAAEATLMPMPRGWGFAEAAGLMVTAPTSYAALVVRARVRPRDWVLVHAAAGGVGLAAVQIARALGARVLATAGTARKREIATAFGAEACVDYTKPGWPDEVKKLTGGRGVDVVFDPVGMVDLSLKCIAWNGRIMYAKMEPGVIEGVWSGLYDMMERGVFKSTVFTDREFVGLESVGEALGMLGARDTWGKVVIKVPQEGESKL